MRKYLFFNKHLQHQPIIHTQTGYRGRFVKSENISKKRNVLITGAHHSGKSRMLNRLHENAEEVWKYQVRPYKFTMGKVAEDKPILKQGETRDNWQFPEPVFLHGLEPLSKWAANDGVIEWWNAKNPELPFSKIPAWKRVELLPDYLKETRAILFVDDAHKLTGRKLMIAKQCVENGFRVIMAASDENRISPNIRKLFLETKPQIIRLTSEVAYDATHLMIWVIVALLMTAGATEIGMALGAFEMFKGGRRAGKQD